MKQFIAVVLTALMSFYSVPVLGAENEPLEKGMFFSSIEACKMAFESGEYRFYQPDPDNFKKIPEMAKGLPRAGCAREDVRENNVKSPAWVILSPNVPVVFNNDGNPIVDGRCHNKIHEFVWLPLLRGLQGTMGLTGPRGPQGPKGDPGQNLVAKKKSHTIWYIVGAAVLGVGIAALASGGGSKDKKMGDGNTIP